MNKREKTSDSKTRQSETEQLLNSLKKKSYVKECFAKDNNCCSQVIFAHSIQNNKILKRISSNGHVLWFSNLSFDVDSLNDSIKLLLPQTGRKKATTFTGFCKYHDNEIFKPIELQDYQKGDIEQEFLFAYRALAKEYHAKKTSLSMTLNGWEKLEGTFNHPLQYYLEGTIAGLQQLKNNKMLFNRMLKNKDFKHLETQCIIFHGEYHLAVSSCFSLERDLQGVIINDHSNLDKDLKYIYLTIFPQNGKTFILFSFLKKNKKFFSPFIHQINQYSINNKQKILSNLLAIYCENIVLSPTRYKKLSQLEKSLFEGIFHETLLGNIGDRLSKPENFNLFI